MRLGHTKSSFQEEPSMRKNTKRSAVVAGAAAVIIGGGAAAWAFTGWSITGNGTAEADGASITPLSAAINFGSTTVYPGFETNIYAAVTNSNKFPVTINGGVTNVTVTSTTPACQSALPASGLITVTVPNDPRVSAGGQTPTTENVVAHVVFGSVPQACSSAHISAAFAFSGVSAA
jgi:hypothetical protein